MLYNSAIQLTHYCIQSFGIPHRVTLSTCSNSRGLLINPAISSSVNHLVYKKRWRGKKNPPKQISFPKLRWHIWMFCLVCQKCKTIQFTVSSNKIIIIMMMRIVRIWNCVFVNYFNCSVIKAPENKAYIIKPLNITKLTVRLSALQRSINKARGEVRKLGKSSWGAGLLMTGKKRYNYLAAKTKLT